MSHGRQAQTYQKSAGGGQMEEGKISWQRGGTRGLDFEFTRNLCFQMARCLRRAGHAWPGRESSAMKHNTSRQAAGIKLAASLRVGIIAVILVLQSAKATARQCTIMPAPPPANNTSTGMCTYEDYCIYPEHILCHQLTIANIEPCICR